jgi:protein-S-isoprenylcysteine O-methyltransferase Ste14
MMSIIAPLYGALSYACFFGSFLYAVGFIHNLGVPRSVDVGPAAPPAVAVAIDLALLSLFALQHSVMARPGFKRWWTRLVPKRLERSTYVLFASIVLGALCWHWRPLPGLVWRVDDQTLRTTLNALAVLGWVILFVSTCLISHFELFGLAQSFRARHGDAEGTPQLRTPGFYKLVRHPIYLGFVIAFWSTPDMTVGHLLFAIGSTGYILLGIALEERDLVRTFGDAYLRYRREVRMLLPLPRLRVRANRREPV